VVIGLFLAVDGFVALAALAFDMPYVIRKEALLDIGDSMPVLIAALAIVRVIAAIGLLLGSRRAWVLVMLVVGAGFIFGFYLYWIGAPSYPRLAINIVIAFYLNQGAVRDYFEWRRDQDVELAQGGR
jgi:hypothetical protein